MSKNHNKRRNSGLLYEFLIRTISQALIDNDKKKSASALKILRKYYKPGTELYKEFRLINSLIKTTVSSESVAASIISEAKSAAKSHDLKALDREKSILIRNINHIINDENFYDQQVNEYKTYATVQTLLNDWRSTNKDLSRLATYEDQLTHWLLTEKQQEPDTMISQEDSPGSSRLLMKIMMRKLNEKYSGILDDDQRSVIKAYAYSTASDDPSVMQKKLTEIRDTLVTSISGFEIQNRENEFVLKKLTEAKQQLLSEDLNVINDDTVTRFMLYIKLKSELESKE